MYLDGNQVEWGPWEVIEYLGETVTVRLEDEIEHEVLTTDLRRPLVVSHAS